MNSTLLAIVLPTVLVVTATAGYRHESIEIAERVIGDIAQRTGAFQVRYVRTEDELPAALSATALRGVRTVLFVNTTGELALPARHELLQWVAGGGSFVGVHSASDTWHEWPEYAAFLGGEFDSHPEEMTAYIVVKDAKHPATTGLKSPHALFEEYYVFRNFFADRVTVLLSMQETSQPLAWYRPHGTGRVFYTALGHREDVWTSPWFQQHLTGAIFWALGHEVGTRRRAVAR